MNKGALQLGKSVSRAFAFLLVAVCAQVHADLNLDWGAFVSQSGFYTSDNSFFNAKTDNRVSTDFSEVGITATTTLFDKIDFSTQIISRREGDIANGSPKIDHLQFTYRFDEAMNHDQAIKVGRFKTALGFYNETRDVPFTRSGIVLPQSVYWERVRNTRTFINGGQYLFDFRTGLNEFNVRASYGKLQIDRSEFDAQAGTKGAGTVDSGYLPHLSIAHEYDGGRIRSALAIFRLSPTFVPDSYDLVKADGSLNIYNKKADVEFQANIFSLEYNTQNWSYTVEHLIGKTVTGQFSNFFPAFTDHPISTYGQVTYRAPHDLEFFVRYDSQVTNGKDPRGKKFAKSLEDIATSFGLQPGSFPLTPDYARYAFDKTVGVGWHPTPAFLIRAELHRVIGTAWIASYGLNSEHLTKEWDLAAIQLSYRFK